MTGILCNTIEEFNALNDKVKVYGDANEMVFDKWGCPVLQKKSDEDKWLFPTKDYIHAALDTDDINAIVELDENWEVIVSE